MREMVCLCKLNNYILLWRKATSVQLIKQQCGCGNERVQGLFDEQFVQFVMLIFRNNTCI